MATSLFTVSSSPPPWISTRSSITSCTPSASLSISTGSIPRPSTTFSINASTSRPAILHCSFLNSPSSFSGLSLGLDLNSSAGMRKGRGGGLVVRAGKAALCQTKRNRSKKSLARTHGFRRRMRTTSGRAILKRRRAKGRKVLCPKSNPNSGKAA